MNDKTEQLKQGVFYTAVARYSSVIISIMMGAILSRLLTPDEFGIVAIITVFVTFFTLISGFGVGPAVVQSQKLSVSDIQSIFLCTIIVGFVLAVIFYFTSPLIAEFYKTPELLNISRCFSVAIFFSSIQSIPMALNQKARNFKGIGIVTLLVQGITGPIAILLAFLNYSYYALVIKSILDSVLVFTFLYFMKPIKIGLSMELRSILKVARFSLFQLLFNIINYFSRNLDNILIGKYLGTTALGYYDKSYRLMLLPVSNLTHVITPVLVPVLASYQDDLKKIYSSYIKIVRILAFIGLPLSIMLYFTASEIIYILFGDQWGESVPVFKLLALTIGIQMTLSSTGSIFQVIDRTDLLFYSGLIGAICSASAIVLGLIYGNSIEAIGVGLVTAFVLNFFQGFFMLIKLALKTSFISFLKVFMYPLAVSAIICAVYMIANIKMAQYGIIVQLSIKVTIFAFIMFCATWLSPSDRDLLTIILKKKSKLGTSQ